MKIGIDCRMFSSRYTGIGRYTFELVRNLLKIDQHNQYVLFLNEPEYTKYKHDFPSVKKILVDAPHYSFAEQIKFLKILNREKLDLMHFTHFNAPLLYKRPSVVTIHDLTLHFFPGKKMRTFFHRIPYYITIRNIVKKARKIITVSKNTEKDLREILKVPASKIKVVYLGVNGDFKPMKNPSQSKKLFEKLSIHKPFLLYSGVWRDHKNVKGLLKAFHILKTHHKQDLQLVITGRADPAYAEDIYNVVRELQLEDDVVFSGLLEEVDLVVLTSQAEVYVFPSFYEGFGLPPLEAMQCHTPTAVSNTSSLPEIVGENNALFFNPYNPADIAERVNKILVDPIIKQTLIHNGQKHLKKFSWSKMAEETLQIYEQSISKTR